MIVPVKCANCNGLHVCVRGAVCDSRCSIGPVPAFEFIPDFDRNPLSPCVRCEERDGCREFCNERQIWLSCMSKLCRARRDMISALQIYSIGELDGGDVA